MRACQSALIALGFSVACVVSAVAQEYKVPEHLLEGTHCHCRANGELFPQGDEVCMMGQLRVCGMNQNVSSWMQTGKTCPTSSRPAQRYAALACPRG
jgi:hypothetical protein